MEIIKNEAELLNMFCAKNNEREVLREPFYNTNFNEVWSTDNYALIQITPNVLAKEYPNYEFRITGLDSPCKKVVSVEAINKALEACPKVDEEIVIQDSEKCEECDGFGEVYWEYTDNSGHTHEREFGCPVCDGTGESTHKKTKKTGKQIVKEDAVINIGNAYFLAYNISKLKFAMDFLDISSVELTHNSPKAPNQFVLNEDIQIVLMPIIFGDNHHNCDAVVELK
ncbi:hypothetical protein [Prevotella intermedia]|uniref:Uncharacterized protein n=1 Tax=Prevotella intermedia TaxID=28131 RepID=A0A2G8I8N4_PREIN|nr:hypothetical protein [Prevotella intermedia]PIK19777.1 hypothetical protein CTI18_12995 [Prevotella intermedia]